ncbi:MAG: biotin/lipoate A/B protein ligase family protein [Nanoarchaeota archaeon]
MKVRLIDTKYNDPYMNMAIDEALLTSKEPVLRFYGWKPAGLSIGYFQFKNSFNFNNIKKHNIKLVRRLTGGNAVLHDKELTYSFIIDEDKMPKSIIDSYKEISKGLLQGLKNLNLNPEMNQEVKKGEKSAVCFNDPSWYEILVNKRKLVGSAQKRINKKLLQHGAILIEVDIDKYCSLFCNYSKELVNKLNQRMTSINQELKKEITYDELKKAMIKGFETELSLNFTEDTLTKKEQELAQKLYMEKYSTDNWNLKW